MTCAPVYSSRDGLSTQVPIGPEEGLKHECAIHCDELVSISKERLSDYVGALSPDKLALLGTALEGRPGAVEIRMNASSRSGRNAEKQSCMGESF